MPPDFRVSRVVLAFSGGAVKAEGLFTFSQVTLSRCAQRLSELEISLEIGEVPDSEEVLTLGVIRVAGAAKVIFQQGVQ